MHLLCELSRGTRFSPCVRWRAGSLQRGGVCAESRASGSGRQRGKDSFQGGKDGFLLKTMAVICSQVWRPSRCRQMEQSRALWLLHLGGGSGGSCAGSRLCRRFGEAGGKRKGSQRPRAHQAALGVGGRELQVTGSGVRATLVSRSLPGPGWQAPAPGTLQNAGSRVQREASDRFRLWHQPRGPPGSCGGGRKAARAVERPERRGAGLGLRAAVPNPAASTPC